MKTKEKKELHAKKLEELRVVLKEAKDALFSLHLEKMHNKLKNIRSIFIKKKEIAKILTIIREKEFEEMEAKNEETSK